ncbi:vanadium-dependent haloperoxidase [Candidatus Entotheonella palauensis]|nr:vanadium-dependent haloperoxidase [Candidatus Entotheonella palauensis]
MRIERLGAFDAARTYAMVNVAMFDAVNGINRRQHKSDLAHALVPPFGAPARANRKAAAAAAAHAVLSALYPDQVSTYDDQLDVHLNRLRGRGRIARGVAWGEYVGDQVVTLRANDGTSPPETQPGGSGPGEFRADFGAAAFRNMTPFAIADPLAYVSAGTPALTSPEYLAAHTEVRLLGDVAYANPTYDEVFNFWKAGGGSVRPPGEWIKIAIVVAGDQGTVRNLSKTSQLFALLSMALADASISVVHDKFTYHFWRPATAIREASTDGNPDTVEDVNWNPRNGSIGGSPEHTSGQSAFAGVGSTILASFYGDDNITFEFTGDNAIAGSRVFASFSDAAREAGRSRILAGIHFEFSNQAGQETGRGVAREVLTSALQPE